MENTNWGDVVCIMGNVLLNFGEFCCLFYDGSYRSTSAKSHGFLSKEAVGFTHTHTHTHVETSKMNKEKGQCIAGLYAKKTGILSNNVLSKSHNSYCPAI
jgi:hypothetical protein